MKIEQINQIITIASDPRFIAIKAGLAKVGLTLTITASENKQPAISQPISHEGLKKHWAKVRAYAIKNRVSILKARAAIKNNKHISNNISKARLLYWEKIRKIQEEKSVNSIRAQEIYRSYYTATNTKVAN